VLIINNKSPPNPLFDKEGEIKIKIENI